MTIQELYDWAIKNDAVDCDICVRDSDGCKTFCIEPEKREGNTVEL